MDDFALLAMDFVGAIGCLIAIARSDAMTRSHGVFICLLLYFVITFIHDLAFYIDPNVVIYRMARISVVRALMLIAAWYGAIVGQGNLVPRETHDTPR